MTHPSDGSFFLSRQNLQNQDEQEISGATKGGSDDGFCDCKINKCRRCFLSLCFTHICDNIDSWPILFIMVYYVVTYKFKGRCDWNVRHGFHTFSQKLLYWLMSIIVLPLGAPPPLGREDPSHLSLQFIIWFRESHQGPDCAHCTKSEEKPIFLKGEKRWAGGLPKLAI